jgi:hypothetical protein
MRCARWITKSTNMHTHSETVTLIAFPLQQWFRERVSILGFTYMACFVIFKLSLSLIIIIYLK